jgi:colicin import membrane protein
MNSDQNFNKFLFVSLCMHLLLVLLAFLSKKSLFTSALVDVKDIHFLKTAVKVDVVAMPQWTLKELKNMQIESSAGSPTESQREIEEKSAKEETPKAGDDLEFKKVEKTKSFQEKLKEKLALESEKKPTLKDQGKNTKGDKNKLDDHKRKELQKLILAGNKLSSGTSLVGDQTDQQLTETELYLSKLSEMVRSNFRLPNYLMNQGYRCRLQIFIDEEGTLIKVAILESSGHADFDERAIRAVEEANPFPAPPEQFKNSAASGKIGLVFPI